jgi:hypothetical protein
VYNYIAQTHFLGNEDATEFRRSGALAFDDSGGCVPYTIYVSLSLYIYIYILYYIIIIYVMILYNIEKKWKQGHVLFVVVRKTCCSSAKGVVAAAGWVVIILLLSRTYRTYEIHIILCYACGYGIVYIMRSLMNACNNNNSRIVPAKFWNPSTHGAFRQVDYDARGLKMFRKNNAETSYRTDYTTTTTTLTVINTYVHVSVFVHNIVIAG